MEERIDILNITGQPIGKDCPKDEAHKNGWFHATVHVWFYTSDGQILMQKRGSKKATYPNLWDVSVAGHVHSGETIEAAVLREVEEEIGLLISKNEIKLLKIQKNVNLHPNGIKDCEFQHVFLVELKANIDTLVLQREEVEAIRLFSPMELELCIKEAHPNFKIVPSDMNYYKYIMSVVKMISKIKPK